MYYLINLRLERWVSDKLIPDINASIYHQFDSYASSKYKSINLIGLDHTGLRLAVHTLELIELSDLERVIEELLKALSHKRIRSRYMNNQILFQFESVRPVKKSDYILSIRKFINSTELSNVKALNVIEKRYYSCLKGIVKRIRDYNISRSISLLNTYIKTETNRNYFINALMFLFKTNYYTKYRTHDCSLIQMHMVSDDIKSTFHRNQIFVMPNFDYLDNRINDIKDQVRKTCFGHAFLLVSSRESVLAYRDFQFVVKDDIKEQPVILEKTFIDQTLKELHNMIGLSQVKQSLNEVFIQAYVNKKYHEGIKSSNHFAFLGGPGTGKTTVARLVARCFYQLGLLDNHKIIEVDRSGLVGAHVGNTALKTKRVLDSAYGGVLFVDEAYSLYGEGKDFGSEAISTIVKHLEDNRSEFVSIFAGYEQPMYKMMTMNQGLSSRINHHIHFEQYSPKEMCLIFKYMADAEGFMLEDGLLDVIYKHYRFVEIEELHGRTVRNDYEKIKRRYAFRIFESESEQKIHVLKRSDFKPKVEILSKNKIIGF